MMKDHTYTHARTHVHAHTHAHVHAHTHAHVHAHTHTRARAHTLVRVWVDSCRYTLLIHVCCVYSTRAVSTHSETHTLPSQNSHVIPARSRPLIHNRHGANPHTAPAVNLRSDTNTHTRTPHTHTHTHTHTQTTPHSALIVWGWAESRINLRSDSKVHYRTNPTTFGGVCLSRFTFPLSCQRCEVVSRGNSPDTPYSLLSSAVHRSPTVEVRTAACGVLLAY
jgi:hypothetical protein